MSLLLALALLPSAWAQEAARVDPPLPVHGDPWSAEIRTYALPPQLSFVSADPAPSSTAPLRWNLGALPPGGQVTIELTAAVAHDVAGQRAVTSTATLTTGNELETLNNSATVSTPLGALAYVPMTAR